MSNLLNSILINQSSKPVNQVNTPAFTFDADGKVKPLSHKGTLLPSKLFASPKEYAHDLKQDILNIGKAAKGKANDYELGRINDVAMKLGSLGLASYLFIKNPLKLDKAMQFIGFGTFFGGMALWPKLTIQAPLKARTGVDIHQKYIDSQGRKKMLHQDPQYDLTDLYSREDLDLMGEKLKVDENLPDRDNFIKQRAKKTAVQGNTLWMMSAFTTPLISALACCGLEKPVSELIEKVNLTSSSFKLKNGAGPVDKIKKYFAEKSLQKFLSNNAGKKTEELIPELTRRLTKTVSPVKSAELNSAIEQELKEMSKKLPDLSEEFAGKISSLHSTLTSFASDSSILNKFIDVRVAEQDGTYIARQWGKVSSRVLKSLNLSNQELKAIARGDDNGIKLLEQKLSELCQRPDSENYKKLINELTKLINKYETKIGKVSGQESSFLSTVQSQASTICKKASDNLGDDFKIIADKLFNPAVKEGTIENTITRYAKGRAAGAQSSFYRLLQTFDIYGADNLGDVIRKELGITDPAKIDELVTLTKRIIVEAKPTDYTEKFTGNSLNIPTSDAYKTIMELLHGTSSQSVIEGQNSIVEKGLEHTFGPEKTSNILKGFKEYKQDVYSKVCGWENGMTPEHQRRVVVPGEKSAIPEEWKRRFMKPGEDKVISDSEFKNRLRNIVSKTSYSERSDLVGSAVSDTLTKCADKTYNTNKWLKIFGISLAAVTAATLLIGLTFGRKSKMEKQVEKENKING